MPEPKPYELADKTIELLRNKAEYRIEDAKQYLLPDFDELNVIQTVNRLFREMGSDNRKVFKELYIARFLEMLAYSVASAVSVPSEDELEEMAELYLERLLSEPNEVTHYVYDTEVIRKRDRTAEAVNAVEGAVNKQDELDAGGRAWLKMTGWYTDFVSDGASVDAMEAAGVKQVMWNAEDDASTCSECRHRNGKNYSIYNVPSKPHLHCRCWLTPVRNK